MTNVTLVVVDVVADDVYDHSIQPDEFVWNRAKNKIIGDFWQNIYVVEDELLLKCPQGYNQ